MNLAVAVLLGEPLLSDSPDGGKMPNLVAGFTGTHLGMTLRQRETVNRLISHCSTLHLGDCVGADAEAYEEAVHLGVMTVGHPPTEARLRAFLSYDEEWAPQPYLVRNRDIIGAGIDGLIAAPKSPIEPTYFRGQGTWTTIRYARQAKRKIWIVQPDGKVVIE